MLNVKVHITGDAETLAKLKKMRSSFLDWSPELKVMGDFLQHYHESSVFETEGGIFGMRWPRLKASYDTWKRTAFPGRGILERTGKMRHSWSRSVEPTSMKLWNTTSYAAFHQTGTRRMQARPLIHVDDGLRNKISDIFKEGLAKKLNQAFS